MSMKFKNNAGSKLAGVLTSDATTITILTGTGANFPGISSDKDYFHATIVGDNGDMEIVRVTAVSGDTLTVIRAQEDTVAKEWPAGTRIENRITAEFLNMAVTGGDGGVTYIDEDTDIDTLLTPGLYVTRNGRFTNAPIKMVLNDNSVPENTYKYIPVFGIDEIGDLLIVYVDTVTSKIRQAFYSVVLPAGVFRTIGSAAGDKFWGFSKSAYASTEAGTMGNVFADGTTIKADSFGFISVVTEGLKATQDKLGTVKPDGITISISEDGTISVANGVEVDNVTIEKNESGVISVKPEGIIDNNTVVLDKDGKISTKSIPYEGGSLVTLIATSLYSNFPHIDEKIPTGPGKNVIATLSDNSITKTWVGKEFCHFDGQDIVFDTPGFYKVAVEWGNAPLKGHKNYDMSYNIAQKNSEHEDYNIIVTQSGEVDLDADTWNYTTFDRIIDAQVGTRIRTWVYTPIPKDNSNRIQTVKFSMQVFKYPVTNEYQINSSEINTYHKTSLRVPNPNSSPNIFDTGDLITNPDVYSGREFTRKTADGYIEILESGMYILVHSVGVVISSKDGNTYDMPHGVAYVNNGAVQSLISQSTVTVRSNDITNDYDESTALVYLTKGNIIAPFIYAPTRIYNPIKVEYSGLRIVKLAAASQITHNHSAYKTIALTNEDNIDNLKPGSYYRPADVTPSGTMPEDITDDFVLVVYGDGEVVNESFKQVVYSYLSPGRVRVREYTSGLWTSWRYSVGNAQVEFSGIAKLATQEQVTAGTEAGAYIVTPALAKAAVETFAPTIVNNTINSSESTLHQTIQNMIDASTPGVTPESFTSILPIAKGGTGNATGNATTATKLATARTITVAGDATGSASFDGSANATIKVDVVNATNAVNATEATTATKWSGATKYVSTAAASGGVNGDIWFQYI